MSSQQANVPAAEDARQRRRRWPIVVVVVVVVVLLVGAVIAADFAARAYARSLIGDELRPALGLEEDAPLDVAVGGFSMLAQLVSGRLERVDVSSESVTFGTLTGAIEATATGVPLNRSLPLTDLSAEFVIAEDQLDTFSDNLSGVPITSVSIEGDEILVAASFDFFGLPIPLSLAILPGSEDGQLTFTPNRIGLNDANVSVDDLRDLFGSAGKEVLQTRAFCVAQYVPQSINLTGVDVRGSELVLAFQGDDAVLSDDALATTGTCPAA